MKFRIHGFQIPAIFKTLIRKKAILIFGTICLAGAWVVQTFWIEPNEDEIECVNREFDDYHRVFNKIDDDQFHYTFLDVSDKKLNDSSSHLNKASCLATWYSDYCLLKNIMIKMDYGLDQTKLANEIYQAELDFGKKFFGVDKMDSLLGAIINKKNIAQEMQLPAQDHANRERATLEAKNNNLRILIITLIILGAVTVNMDKSIDYLRSEIPPK